MLKKEYGMNEVVLVENNVIKLSDGIHLIESRYDKIIAKIGSQSDVYELC